MAEPVKAFDASTLIDRGSMKPAVQYLAKRWGIDYETALWRVQEWGKRHPNPNDAPLLSRKPGTIASYYDTLTQTRRTKENFKIKSDYEHRKEMREIDSTYDPLPF